MHVKTVDARHGRFSYYEGDTFVGKSLELYREYSEDEVAGVLRLIPPDGVVIEVGANIGTITVPMAKVAARIIAYEAQPQTGMLLRNNLTANGIDNVEIKACAAGDGYGSVDMPALTEVKNKNFGGVSIGAGSMTVPMETIDGLQLSQLNLLKIDAEGSELQVLKGAEQTVMRCRPIIYVENDRKEKADDLIGWLIDHGYRCFWHRPYLFNPKNFANEQRNVFGQIISINMLCVPTDVRDENGYYRVNGLDEVADLRVGPDMYEREEKRFRIETEHHPDDLTARLLVAHNCALQGKRDEARKLIAENLRRNAKHYPSLHILGLLDLQAGNYKDGWAGYEYRYDIKERAHFGGDRDFAVPKWDGSPTNDTVLIWCEQGFGDNLMCARFMYHVLARAPNSIFETQPQLFELFEHSHLCPAGRLYRRGRTLPKYNYHCSLPSLPYVLRLNSERDLWSKPYLQADPTMVEVWHKRLEHVPFKIGVCYRGSARSERPWSRDIDIALLDPILVDYSPWIDLTQAGQFESFADTAACISALDLVVSVDTSITHLAGALGVPTILLLSTEPDFRWKLDTRKTCWYDSVTILRQNKFLDWSNVIDETAAIIKKRAMETCRATSGSIRAFSITA